MAAEDVYVCPAGKKLAYHYTTEENGLVLRRYWTNVCQNCASSPLAPPAKERWITRWEHEHILEAVQRRLDEHPEKMRQRRETVEHPFGTIKARMGATHFLDEDAATSCLRDGATRAGLQSDPGHEHHGHSAAHGSDEGLAKPEKASSKPPDQNCYASTLPGQSVSTQPRPKAVIPLVQILDQQRTEFVERGDYRDFTGSIPLLRIAASASSDPRKWINR